MRKAILVAEDTSEELKLMAKSGGKATEEASSSELVPAYSTWYRELYGSEDPETVEKELAGLMGKGGVCNAVLKKELVWHCPVCAKEENAIICQKCYQQSVHTGHKAYKKSTFGGTCDCGDPDVWEPSGACVVHASGFVDESKITPDLLPERIRTRFVQGLNKLVAALNEHCLRLEDLLQGYESMSAEERERNIDPLYEVEEAEIVEIVQVLIHLAKDVSKVLLHMIAARFHGHILASETKHACNVRRFATEDERLHFEADCAVHKINPQLCKIASPTSHPCTCTVIENLMKAMLYLSNNTQQWLCHNLFYPLLNNRRIKYYMALSYMANYTQIIPYSAANLNLLPTLAVQFLAYEDVILTVLNTDEYISQYLAEIARIIQLLKIKYDKGPATMLNLRQEILHAHNDFKPIIKEHYSKLLLPFLLRYLQVVGGFSELERVRREPGPSGLPTAYISLTHEIGGVLEAIFVALLSALDLSNVSIGQQIGIAFKNLILSQKQFPLSDNDYLFSGLQYRMLSLFLIHYLLLQYWGRCNAADLPGLKAFIKQAITEVFGFATPAEFQDFVEYTLSQLLRFLGFDLHIQLGIWGNQVIKPTRVEPKAEVERALIAIFLLVQEPRSDLLNWLFKMMLPDAPAVWTYFEAISNKESAGVETIEAAAKDGSKDTKSRLIENALFMFCSMLSSEELYFGPFYRTKAQKQILASRPERVKAAINSFVEYSTLVNIVMTYATKADASGITHEEIKAGFADSLRDMNKIERCLENHWKMFLNPLNRVYKFQPAEGILKLYDPFLYYVKSLANNENHHLTTIFARLRDPCKLDLWLGELTKDPPVTTTLPSGAPLVPFKSLLREQWAQSNILEQMTKLLDADPANVTPWMFRCAFKLLAACAPYSGDKAKALGKLMAKHAPRLTFDAGMLDIVEKCRQTFAPGETVAEDSKAAASLELSRSPSCEWKQKSNEAKQKAKEEFAKMVQAFKNKNKIILSETQSGDYTTMGEVCGYCRDKVQASTFVKEPYGKLIHIHPSQMYGHFLKQVLAEPSAAWAPKSQLPLIPGLTHGLALTSCGHLMHERCLKLITEKLPMNPVSIIDANYAQKIFLCPLCKVCGNGLLTPYAILLLGEAAGAQKMMDGVLSEMQSAYSQLLGKQQDSISHFKMICDFIVYQFHLIDLTSVADFTTKEDCIRSLVFCLKRLVEPHIYDEMMAIKRDIDQCVGFLAGDSSALFSADLVAVFTQLIVAGKLMDNQTNAAVIYAELVHKTGEIIKLAIIQIAFRVVCESLQGKLSCETLQQALPLTDTSILLKSRRDIEHRLLPLLKKLLCIKMILFPTPGRDSGADVAKVGWLSETHGSEFYLAALDIKQDPFTSLLDSAPMPEKEAFYRTPPVSLDWMLGCWHKLLERVAAGQSKDAPLSVQLPMLATYDAGYRKFNFVVLKDDFNELQLDYAEQPCRSCKKTVQDSALCLLCGELLCVSNRCCFKEGMGELTYHSLHCPSGAGMFLRLITLNLILKHLYWRCFVLASVRCCVKFRYNESLDLSIGANKR